MTATASIINNTDLAWNQTTTIVIAALRAGDVDHISEDAIAKQCGVKLRNVSMLLADAVEEGPLIRLRNADGDLGYSLREKVKATPAPTPAPKPAAMTAAPSNSLGQLLRDRIDDAGDTAPVYTRPTPPTEPQTTPDRKQVTVITRAAKPAQLKVGERLPEIDVASIGVTYGVTCPPRGTVKRGSYWDPLFARLDRIGAASDVIAIEYRGSCSKAKDHWHKAHPKHRLEVRKCEGGQGFRLFRVA